MPVRLADAVTFLTANDDGLKKGLAEGEKAVGGWGSAINGMLMGAGMAAFNAVAGAAQQAVGYLGDAVSKASDMSETTSKVGVLFGDAGDNVLAWADNAADAFGQSRQQALDAAATFAIFGKSAGLGGDELQKFSTDFVGLASDLASFNNTSPEEAIDAIGAALRGETEPLRKYGVLLDDASMRQKALQLGLIKTTKEALTPQQKVLAAHALIYEQTADAQGDFAKTQDGLANSQRKLEASLTNLQTKLGEALLPVMLAFTHAMNNLAVQVLPIIQPAIEGIAEAFRGFFYMLDEGWTLVGALKVSILETFGDNAITQAIIGLIETIDQLWRAIGMIFGQGGTFEDDPPWLQSVKQFAPVVEEIMTNIQTWVQSALSVAQEMFAGFGATVSKAIGENLNFFAAWFDENMPRIQQIVETVLTAISDFWTAHGQKILATISSLFNWMVSFFQLQFRTVLNIVQLFLQVFTGDWEGAGKTLQNILNDWKRFIETTIKSIIENIKAWFKSVDWGAIGRGILEGIAAGIRNGANFIKDAATSAANGAFDAAKNFLGIHSPSQLAAAEIGEPFAQGIGVGIRNALGDLAGGVNVGLQGLMGGIQTPAGAGAAAAGTFNITINVNGGDATAVGGAARDGVLSALRSAGLR